jgi:UDP-GlcNAc:undecaprenyl-phosphate/decaprenyl-phosphate GlcNAc-1-phosphate transferase
MISQLSAAPHRTIATPVVKAVHHALATPAVKAVHHAFATPHPSPGLQSLPGDVNIIWLCVITFVLAAIACAGVTPLVRRMAFKVGVFDDPNDDRRVHTQPTPRLGGIAIYLGFMLALFTMLNFALTHSFVIQHYLDTPDLAHLIGLLFGGTLMMGVGLWDDVMTMRPRDKFLAQFAVSFVAVVMYGFTIQQMKVPHFGFIDLGWFAIPFSIFWYMGMVNAINFLDGLDGLVTGVTIIAALTMIVVSVWKGQYLVAITMAALAGSAAGFLPFNYNPARIFMGDGGSLFIGFVLASAAVEGKAKGAIAISLVVPFLIILAFPILDTAHVIIRRLRSGAPLFAADRSHTHHKLLDLGLSQRAAVNLIYAVCGVLCALVLVLARPGGPHLF